MQSVEGGRRFKPGATAINNRAAVLNAGNLIMAAVIYSSHGSYLAPADLMGGAEGVRENN